MQGRIAYALEMQGDHQASCIWARAYAIRPYVNNDLNPIVPFNKNPCKIERFGAPMLPP